jgi:hypothetical protein
MELETMSREIVDVVETLEGGYRGGAASLLSHPRLSLQKLPGRER